MSVCVCCLCLYVLCVCVCGVYVCVCVCACVCVCVYVCVFFLKGQQTVFNTGGPSEESKAYSYSPLDLDPCGPPYPDMDRIMSNG